MYEFYDFFFRKKMSQIIIFFAHSVRKAKILKFLDVFDENGYCLLIEDTKKNYSFLCCKKSVA